MNRSPIVAHVVSAIAAPLIFLATFGLVSDPSWFSVFFSALVGAPLCLFVRPAASVARVTAAPDASPPAPPPLPPTIDIEAIEATRQQSLAAMRAATKARAADKKADLSWQEQHQRLVERNRALPVDDPLAKWKQSASASGSAHRSSKKKRVALVRGRKLDVVRFDYIDGEGEYSSRRVFVNVIAAEYFKGIDADVMETRTFRYDRVVGCVTSETSGEVATPEEWADGFR
ncbi:MAG: hypothetical protein HYU78_02330 [Rhodocyclales bacterium]|nr:hypothetical protein [Rhodocyclales bacterium]